MVRPSFEAQELQRTLHSSEFWSLCVDRLRGAAALRRTDLAFSGLPALQEENARVITMLRHCLIDGIVVDMRAAPANNGPAFEDGMRSLRDALSQTFARVVVLVASAAGELQMKRIHASEHSGFAVTRDAIEAWRLAAASKPSDPNR